MMDKIVFVVKQLSQPRSIKRIVSIQQAGYDVKVYGFDSGIYSDNLKGLPFSIQKIYRRNKADSRLKKIFFFINSVREILKENDGALFYLFAYEVAPIAYFLGCRRYIYEEADISAARFNNRFLRRILLAIDRKTVSNSLLTVFTSQGFIDYLFPINKPNNIILVPNKLSRYFDQHIRDSVIKNPIDYSHIKFGFIGLIRYPDTLCRFAKVIGRCYPQHEFHFYGDVERPSYVDDEIKGYHNVYFHGPFVNPQDLKAIYESIDINVVCYDTKSGNVNILEPNKLYESIFFYAPMLVSKGTFLAKRVDDYGVGEAIDASNDDSIIKYVDSVSGDVTDSYIEKMKLIPTEELLDNEEALLRLINDIKTSD